eukprot:TRINITY_DN72946_c0_g1_i1.p1 TRINITY_DN72946_c0_g1~~TRINITY_DN72946_c0_g1_i1.p1  ORF type:complete len:765 (-),score=67.59 TRINITY_DN72946_c0_g1_i1:61-2355(-)
MANSLVFSASDFATCSNGCIFKTIQGELKLAPKPQGSTRDAWALYCTFLVVSMQLGFAMIEVGSCRAAHRMTVLVKNAIDCPTVLLGLMVHCELFSSAFVRDSSGELDEKVLLKNWVFSATCATICSGAMAERVHVIAYMAYAFCMGCIIYPHLAAGAWSHAGILKEAFDGSLIQNHAYHDCAGSGVVHFAGGCAALVGTSMLGRRIMTAEWNSPLSSPLTLSTPSDDASGSSAPSLVLTSDELRRNLQKRSAKKSWPRRFDNGTRDKAEFQDAHFLQALGMFILWVAWYGFNAGTILETRQAGIVALNTTLGAGGAGLGAFVYSLLMEKHLDVGLLCNGLLSGLVAVTAACDIATHYSAIGIGAGAGFVVFPAGRALLHRFRIDDPADAVAVHGACGFYGVLVVAFCLPNCAELRSLGDGLSEQIRFCDAGHHMGKQLLAQFLGAAMQALWTSVCVLILWSPFVVSECMRAGEDECLQRTCEILIASALDEAPGREDTLGEELYVCLTWSPAVRRVMRKHGWEDDGLGRVSLAQFSPGTSLVICRDIQHVREEGIATALEIAGWRPLQYLAGYCGRRSFFRCVFSLLRLRVTPKGELSGLGSSDIQGRLFAGRAQRMIAKMRQKSAKERMATTASLSKQVLELKAVIESQDALLTSLATVRTQRRLLGSPVAGSDTGSISPVSSSVKSVNSGSDYAGRTVTDQTLAALRGYPSPSVIGRSSLAPGAVQPANLTARLLSVIENQQSLLAHVHRTPTAEEDNTHR